MAERPSAGGCVRRPHRPARPRLPAPCTCWPWCGRRRRC